MAEQGDPNDWKFSGNTLGEANRVMRILFDQNRQVWRHVYFLRWTVWLLLAWNAVLTLVWNLV